MKPMPPPTLLVLAAGMGRRYGGLKQLDPIGPCGETIIDYSVYDALRAGFRKLVFVIRREMEPAFRQTLCAHFEDRIAVEFAYQELDTLPAGYSIPPSRTKPWGTTHAILVASEAITENFAVINSDDFYGANSFRILAQHLQADLSTYAMVGFQLSKTLSDFGAVSRGVCQLDDAGLLRQIVEFKSIQRDGTQIADTDAAGRVTSFTGSELVSMNMWGFTPGIIENLREEFLKFLKDESRNLQAECYLPTAVNQLIRNGRARVNILPTPDAWFGVTYREDRPHAVDCLRRLIEAVSYPARLWL